MNDYLEWLTAELIFLSILDAHDARAAPVGAGNVRCESPSQSAFLPAPPFLHLHACSGFVCRQRARPSFPADGGMATALSETRTRSCMTEITSC